MISTNQSPETPRNKQTDVRGAHWLCLWTVGFLLVLLSIKLARATTGVAPFWLPVAVTFSAMMLMPVKKWAAVVATSVSGGVAAHLLLGTLPTDIVVFAFLNALGPCVVALGMRSCGHPEWDLSPRSLAAFAGAALVASALLATLGALWRWQYHGSVFGEVWPEWFVSNALGFLVGTPFILSWAEPALRPTLRIRFLAEASVLAVLVAGVSYVALASTLPLLFVIFPLLALVTARLGLAGATVGVVTFTAVTLACMIAGIGPIAALAETSMFVKMLLLRAYLLTGKAGR